MTHALTPQRRRHIFVTSALTAGLGALLVLGLDLGATHPALSGLVTVLFLINSYMLISAAGVALAGVARAPARAPQTLPPADRCAVLWLLCAEPPEAVARRIAAFCDALDHAGQGANTQVFVLSDTTDPQALAREQAAFRPLDARIIYRARTAPVGRKPGNLLDWLTRYGTEFDTMLVLDADSSFTLARLTDLRQRMAADPELGLIQSAISLRPADTRFGHMQRLSSRLSGPVFATGLARLSGDAVAITGGITRCCACAPSSKSRTCRILSGPPPFGGPVLSHDFIEAAYLRRAGWKVVIDPMRAAVSRMRPKPLPPICAATGVGRKAICNICACLAWQACTRPAACT
jgi:membrane glycosyltransferase